MKRLQMPSGITGSSSSRFFFDDFVKKTPGSWQEDFAQGLLQFLALVRNAARGLCMILCTCTGPCETFFKRS